MAKRDVLMATTFGKRIAEEETDALEDYFVETDQWRKVFSGEVDIVYGPKGSGKSAIYALLRQRKDDLRKRGVVPAAGETIRGTPAFDDIVADPPTSEEQFRGLWKLYFLSIIGSALRVIGFEGDSAVQLMQSLEDAGLVASEWSLRGMLRSALDLVRRIDGVAGEVKVGELTGQPEGFVAKVTLREPTAEQRKYDPRYLEMGRTFFDSLVRYCRTKAGYAALSDVRTKQKRDEMESYFLAETLKYLYLLFAKRDTFDLNKVVFNTEAHPLRRTW